MHQSNYHWSLVKDGTENLGPKRTQGKGAKLLKQQFKSFRFYEVYCKHTQICKPTQRTYSISFVFVVADNTPLIPNAAILLGESSIKKVCQRARFDYIIHRLAVGTQLLSEVDAHTV